MKVIMPRIQKDWVDQILVVDGNSTDGTAEYARSMGYDVVLQKKKGIRHAFIEAWPEIKGDLVITFSPDGNATPEDIPLLIEKIEEGYDMVIASRYAPGAHSDDDGMITGFGNWLFTKLISVLHGHNYYDAMTIFRIYPTSMFYELDMHLEESYAPEKWYNTILGCEPLISIRAAKMRKRITEIPSTELARIGGEAKVQPLRWGLGYMTQVWREIFYWTKKPKEARAKLKENKNVHA